MKLICSLLADSFGHTLAHGLCILGVFDTKKLPSPEKGLRFSVVLAFQPSSSEGDRCHVKASLIDNYGQLIYRSRNEPVEVNGKSHFPLQPSYCALEMTIDSISCGLYTIEVSVDDKVVRLLPLQIRS